MTQKPKIEPVDWYERFLEQEHINIRLRMRINAVLAENDRLKKDLMQLMKKLTQSRKGAKDGKV